MHSASTKEIGEREKEGTGRVYFEEYLPYSCGNKRKEIIRKRKKLNRGRKSLGKGKAMETYKILIKLYAIIKGAVSKRTNLSEKLQY